MNLKRNEDFSQKIQGVLPRTFYGTFLNVAASEAFLKGCSIDKERRPWHCATHPVSPPHFQIQDMIKQVD